MGVGNLLGIWQFFTLIYLSIRNEYVAQSKVSARIYVCKTICILFERGLQGKKGYFSRVIFEQISELAYRYDVNVNRSPYITVHQKANLLLKVVTSQLHV